MDTQLQLHIPKDFRTKFLQKLSSIWVRELFLVTVSGIELGVSDVIILGYTPVLLLYLNFLVISGQILFGAGAIWSNGDPYRFLSSLHPYYSSGDRQSSTI